MEKISEMKIRDFITALDSKKPMPGGGSAAGVAGAMAAALAGMVAHMTLGKEKYRSSEEDMKKLIEDSHRLHLAMEDLAQKDADLYSKVLAAYKLPKGTEEEKKTRQKAVENATKEGIEATAEMMENCVEIEKMAFTAVTKGSQMLATDAVAAAALAAACARICYFNAKANLGYLKDRDYCENCADELVMLLDETEYLEGRITDMVDESGD